MSTNQITAERGETSPAILPPARIGVVGGGQLGRMFAMEAKKMGYRVRVLDPQEDAPAAQVADEAVVGDFEDEEVVFRFAEGCEVVTFEFENVAVEPLWALVRRGQRVLPSPDVLETTQNREREKGFLSKNGFPCAKYEVLGSEEELRAIGGRFPLPAVLKSAAFGYDGKGQVRIGEGFDAGESWQRMGGRRGILEQWIDFIAELSVVCARWADGRTACFRVVENKHRNHILDVTIAPGRFSQRVAERAEDLAKAIAERLGVVGLLTVEFFLTREGEVLVNELAPRPHNSGHFSFDACVCSQFEAHVRAICGLPVGSLEQLRPAVMVNLLGDLWEGGNAPEWERLLVEPNLKLHLYGKGEARRGRKMGHFTVLGRSLEEAIAGANRAREWLGLPLIEERTNEWA